MSTSQWDEIKKLAADFQRTQLASSLQRLGDRNCVEIVKKLIELDLIKVIFTCDGKEYLTPEHLQKEIEDELIVNGGRIELTQLVPILNVDLVHIEARAGDLVRSTLSDPENRISLVQGRLISREYKDKLAEEINEKLSISGRVTVGDLTKLYDLPSNFIDNDIISSRLGSIIKGSRNRRDPKIIETDSYTNSYRCKIRGVLSAITKPTSLPSLVTRYSFPQGTLDDIVKELLDDSVVKGSVSGKVFTPEIYLKSQQEWIDNFYGENRYIEFESLARIGVSDGKGFLTKRFPDIVLLKSCGVSKDIVSQVESSVEECIINKDFVDLSSMLPSVISGPDLSMIFEKATSSKNFSSKNFSEKSVHLLCDSFIVSTEFVDSLKSPLVKLMETKAEVDLKGGKLFQVFASQVAAKEAILEEEENAKGRMSKKEERKKKVASKVNTGGGTQGREVKMKATKKKYNPRDKKSRDFDSDEDDGVESSTQEELVFMDLDEISTHLKEHQQDLKDTENDSLVEEISTLLYPFLQSKYKEVARKVFDSASSETDSSSKRKKTMAELQSSLSNNHALIHLFSKGLEKVTDESLKKDLTKYLEKSLLSEVISSVITFLSNEENVSLSNPDSRIKAINKLEPEMKEQLTTLNSASVEDFNQVLEDVSMKCCNVMLKPIDKRREKVLLSEMKNNLIHQMKESDDLALKLHLIVTSLFLALTGQALHSSGKFVPQIIALLKELKLKEEIMSKLSEAEKCVVNLIKKKENDDEKARLKQLIEQLQDSVENFKLGDDTKTDTQESV